MPITSENLESVIAKLGAMLSQMDAEDRAHFNWGLTAYLDLPPGVFEAEIAKREQYHLSNATADFIRNAVLTQDTTGDVHPDIAAAFSRLQTCPEEKQIMLVQQLAYSIYTDMEWEKVLAKPQDDFIEALEFRSSEQ